MAVSGFDYFYKSRLSLNSSSYVIHYGFDDVSSLPTITNATGTSQPLYTGHLSSVGTFASNPGSGHFSNQYIAIQNTTGQFDNDFWTMFFVYEKQGVHNGTLFSNLAQQGGIYSGFAIQTNDANKIVFSTYDDKGPVYKVSNTIYGSKNAVAIVRALNSVAIHYFDFNSKTLVSENFEIDSNYLLPSSKWYLGQGVNSPFKPYQFSGYIDEFVYIKDALNPYNVARLFSGFYAQKTTTGIVVDSGFMRSFGMEGINYLREVDNFDVSEIYTSPTGDNKTNLNKTANFDQVQQAYKLPKGYLNTELQVYVNGIEQMPSGFAVTGNIYTSGKSLFSNVTVLSNYIYTDNNWGDSLDYVYYDVVSGVPLYYYTTGTVVPIDISNSKSVFLNGQKLIQDYDYSVGVGSFTLGAGHATGFLSIQLNDNDLNYKITGQFASVITNKFFRNSSCTWFNGQRQRLGTEYIEISSTDLLANSGNFKVIEPIIYDDNQQFFNI